MLGRRPWREELEIIDRTMKAISGVTDPEEMVGLYFDGIGELLPINDYLSAGPFEKIDESHPAVVEARESVEKRIATFLSINGTRSVDSFHRELGHIMWEYCGMERT